MRAMWIGTETARKFSLGNEFFDLKEGHVTPPGSLLLRNAESIYGLWFVTLQYYPAAMQGEPRLGEVDLGEPDKDGLRSFQGRAAHGALRIAREWMVVILCTILEAYVKGILEFAASCDPAIVDEHSADVTISASEVLGASALDDLKPVVVRRWASRWLENRRDPRAWIRGFEEMGVVGFVDGLGDHLEEMLGTRHLMVHNAGIVDEAYLKRRPGCGLSIGEHRVLSEQELRDYIGATFEFFAPIEAAFIRKYVSPSEVA